MPRHKLTPNQVIAHNLRRARMLNGWTQETAAERLAPYLGERWSRVVFSAAERSITGERIRHFSADEIVAFAAAFDFPVAFFFTPPRSLASGVDPRTGFPERDPVEAIAPPKAQEPLTPDQLDRLVRAPLDEWVAAKEEQHLQRHGEALGMTIHRKAR